VLSVSCGLGAGQAVLLSLSGKLLRCVISLLLHQHATVARSCYYTIIIIMRPCGWHALHICCAAHIIFINYDLATGPSVLYLVAG